jgi:transposase
VSKRKRRWSRDFKEAAVARMESAETVQGLAHELGIYRGLLFKWRRELTGGGAVVLRPAGRPVRSRERAAIADAGAVPADLAAETRRIEELERKIGQQQLELDFFRAALRHVGEQRLNKGGPGETPSSR